MADTIIPASETTSTEEASDIENFGPTSIRGNERATTGDHKGPPGQAQGPHSATTPPLVPTGLPSPLQEPGSADTMELDLELGEELIIEDFTIDGICGVY